MGGKKKVTLRQMQKTQVQKDRGQKNSARLREKKSLGITPPDSKNEKILKELKKMKVLTPYLVATHFNLRLSVAKGFLGELNQRGIIEFISGSKNLKIYRPLE